MGSSRRLWPWGSVRPSPVLVVARRFRVVDFPVDTGTRAAERRPQRGGEGATIRPMRVTVLFALVAALVAVAPASSTVGSGLHGLVKVPIGVCLDGGACNGGASDITLAFSAEGRAVKRVVSNDTGRYRIMLRPGTYTVTAPLMDSPKVRVFPKTVRVVKGSFRRVDFTVDTGVRPP